MTLEEIVSTAARYLEKSHADLIIDEIDQGLVAINHVRRLAEQTNDFNFTKRLLTVAVDGVTGGRLDEAVEYGQSETDCPCKFQIKTVVDAGVFDTYGNFLPVNWTTASASLNTQRLDNYLAIPRIPTDGQALCGPFGQQRFVFSGNRVLLFPKPQSGELTVTLGIDAYTFTPDWTEDDFDEDDPPQAWEEPWLFHGAMYLQWATVVQLNHIFKGFVFRQEGNLPPPEKLRDEGLDAMQRWDNFRFEQFRRHSR